jgi:hypothetical protein
LELADFACEAAIIWARPSTTLNVNILNSRVTSDILVSEV